VGLGGGLGDGGGEGGGGGGEGGGSKGGGIGGPTSNVVVVTAEREMPRVLASAAGASDACCAARAP